MGATHDEFTRFMHWLRQQESEADVRRVAKIIHRHIGTLIPTVRNGGQRPLVLTPFLRRSLDETSDVIDAAAPDVAAAPLPWTRLQKLVVGPFRGFRRAEEFDLSKSIVLFYGPNGSGKSSLCEALEFALLGDVEEASAKRIDSLQDYFDNFHERRHVAPKLWSTGAGDGTPVAPNAELLRFSIIEKNRIDGFSRLGARSPAQSGPLIATLFGLEAFDTFVNNFTTTLDRNLQLETPQQGALALKKAALERSVQNVENSDATLRAFDAEQEQIAVEFGQDCTFAQLLDMLGLSGQPGRLQAVVALLDEQIPALSDVTTAAVVGTRKSIRAKQDALTECNGKLAERAAQVSYRHLYRTVLALQSPDADACPACETPLDAVRTNPFTRATQGLDLLQDLAALEAEQAELQVQISQLVIELRTAVLTCDRLGVLNEAILEPLQTWARQPGQAPVLPAGLITSAVWRECLRAVRRLETRDQGIRERQAARDDLTVERTRLEGAKDQVGEIRGRRNQHLELIRLDRERIAGFDAQNADLILAAAQEAERYTYEIRIQDAYAGFLEMLKLYREGLPEVLLADLNETTRDLYNQFNADDHASDKLAKVTLPLRGGERIQVAFHGADNDHHDALKVLSEGHLRCLGLAILLAKNIKLNLPLLIFDDAVNAIDHDHRAGIRATVFGDPRLTAKQILVTCHSNEFIKDVQNQLPEGASKLYVLDHHAGDHQPRVQGGSDRHYLVRARERLADGDQRQCLASCRQSLENLTARLWKGLLNKEQDLGRMSLVLKSPTDRPELRNLTIELEKRIAKGFERGVLQGASWTSRHEGLKELLLIPEGHMAWLYLNKGTHDEEDREDFELGVVRQIVAALSKISATMAT